MSYSVWSLLRGALSGHRNWSPAWRTPTAKRASALLANGVQLIGRSFKLHRPRGIYSCGIEEPTGLMDVGQGARRIPNVRATLVPIHEELVAESVNCWPSVAFDLGALTSWFSAVLPAGFYYKTFKWPSWQLFEPTIRRMAGLGRVSRERDPDRYEEVAADADVLVVGGGVAGLSAAVSAARAGANTTLLASGGYLGGALGWRGDKEVAELVSSAQQVGVRLLTRTMAFGVYDHNLVCASESRVPDGSGGARHGGLLRERLWKIRARAVVAATGAFERPMVFPDNDRPGVMLAGAAEKYAQAFGVVCGQRVVIAANSDSAYAVAQSLRSLGVHVVALVDRRPASLAGGDLSGCVSRGPMSRSPAREPATGGRFCGAVEDPLRRIRDRRGPPCCSEMAPRAVKRAQNAPRRGIPFAPGPFGPRIGRFNAFLR